MEDENPAGQQDPTETELLQTQITELKENALQSDAQWRKDALKRIEQVRKGDMAIVVKDATGNAVKDATVKIKQTKHRLF